MPFQKSLLKVPYNLNVALALTKIAIGNIVEIGHIFRYTKLE